MSMKNEDKMWTPGPWKVNKYGSIGAGPLGHTPIVAHAEPFYGEDTRDGDSGANARLLAAAPEMCEALRGVLSIVDKFYEFCDNRNRPCGEYGSECPIGMGEWISKEDRATVANARTVLTKACGESEAQP